MPCYLVIGWLGALLYPQFLDLQLLSMVDVDVALVVDRLYLIASLVISYSDDMVWWSLSIFYLAVAVRIDRRHLLMDNFSFFLSL